VAAIRGRPEAIETRLATAESRLALTTQPPGEGDCGAVISPLRVAA